jgi:uncharacterized membrane protein
MRIATTFPLLAGVLLAACQPGAPADPGAADAPTPAASSSDKTPAPAPAMPQSQSSPAGAAMHWQCGELLVDAEATSESLRLRFSGRSLVLPHVESLTGARYADDAGNEFMRQGDGAVLMLAGEEQRDCARSDRASPWTEAEARGIVYRAVGSEPGWLVEVGSGDDPPLHAELDYGERKLDIARVTGISSTPGYGGKLADGTDVVLRTRHEPCRDGMSGEAFETTAELMVGDKVYRGCGAYLDDRQAPRAPHAAAVTGKT